MIMLCLAWIPVADLEAREKWTTFHQLVRPILEKHCAECHSGSKRKGGFSMNTRESILAGSETEEVVTPGKSKKSFLLELILEPDPEFRMPPEDKDPVTPEEAAIIAQWIDNGLDWPEGFTLGKVARRAPLKLKKVDLEHSIDEVHPVDQILNRHLEKSEESLSGRTEWNRWVRKASLDVIGLLPSQELQSQFNGKSDWESAPDVIDYLLDQKEAYAGHWLTYWNDWLRNDYKGTGFIDGGRRQITGWLFQSLYTNKPYDKFVSELVTSSPGAEGFLHGIKWRGTINDSQRREMQSAQSISQVFLGTNLKCASCHDSFINDWKLKEAYAFASVFADSPLELHRCDKPVGKKVEAGFLYPELGEIPEGLERGERLKTLSQLVTSRENGRFARTMVNRLWAHFFGAGIIESLDDMDQPPFSDDLLDWLAHDLQANDYDLKSTIRWITTSRAYQSQPLSGQTTGKEGEIIFTGPVTRRLSAEQFVDAVSEISRTSLESNNAMAKRDGRGQGGQLKEITDVLTSHKLAHKESGSPAPSSDLAHWIWSSPGAASTAPAGEVVTFTKSFSLDSKPGSSSLIATGDNSIKVSINGNQVAASSEWSSPINIDVQKFLKKGENEIIIEAKNGGDAPNPAGAILHLTARNKAGQVIATIGTDDSWANTTHSDSASQPATHVLGKWNMGPWNMSAKLTTSGNWTDPEKIRASYLFTDELARAMGRPSREQIVTKRDPYATTLELIELTNGSTLDAMLSAGAAQWMPEFHDSPAHAIRQIFLLALNRTPNENEFETALAMTGDEPGKEIIQDFLWVLLMQPDFQFID